MIYSVYIRNIFNVFTVGRLILTLLGKKEETMDNRRKWQTCLQINVVFHHIVSKQQKNSHLS